MEQLDCGLKNADCGLQIDFEDLICFFNPKSEITITPLFQYSRGLVTWEAYMTLQPLEMCLSGVARKPLLLTEPCAS